MGTRILIINQFPLFPDFVVVLLLVVQLYNTDAVSLVTSTCMNTTYLLACSYGGHVVGSLKCIKRVEHRALFIKC